MLSKWRYVGVIQVALPKYSRGKKNGFKMNQTFYFLCFLHLAVVLCHCSTVLRWSMTLEVNTQGWIYFSLYVGIQPFSLATSINRGPATWGILTVFYLFYVVGTAFISKLGSGVSHPLLWMGLWSPCNFSSLMGKKTFSQDTFLKVLLSMTFD